jgi:hypothetical protein
MKKLPFEFYDLGEQSVKNIAQSVRVYRLVMGGRGPELRSSQSVAPLPDVEADIPSLSEGEPIVPAFDPQAVEIEFWDSIKNSIRASEYEATSNSILRAASSPLPEFVSTRSRKTPSACGIRTTGKLSCRFGSLSARAIIPRRSRHASKNIPTVSLALLLGSA